MRILPLLCRKRVLAVVQPPQEGLHLEGHLLDIVVCPLVLRSCLLAFVSLHSCLSLSLPPHYGMGYDADSRFRKLRSKRSKTASK